MWLYRKILLSRLSRFATACRVGDHISYKIFGITVAKGNARDGW